MAQSVFDSLVANQKSALDTLFRFSNISLNTTEKIARHHLSAARNALDAQLEHHQSALAAKGLNQLLSLGTSFAKPRSNRGPATTAACTTSMHPPKMITSSCSSTATRN